MEKREEKEGPATNDFCRVHADRMPTRIISGPY